MPQTLDYSRQLYKGDYRFRSANALAAAIILALMGIVYGVIAARARAPDELIFRLGFFAGFLLCAAGCVYIVFRAWNDGKQVFTISTDGIVARGKLTPWERITAVSCYGKASSKRVMPYFSTGGFHPPVHLQTTPAMSGAEYEKLIEMLRTEILPLHPTLQLGGYQREA